MSNGVRIGARRRPADPAHRLSTAWVLVCLGVALLGVVLVSASLGQLVVPADRVLGSVLHRVGLSWLPSPGSHIAEQTLWNVRFPRVVMGVVVGCGLGVAGALMQAIFRNPLAEPSTVGVSSGAAVGASLVILTGWNALGTALTAPVAAFVCGLGTTGLVYLLSRRSGRTEVVTLILTGIAINAIANAAVSFIVFAAPSSARGQIVFWQMGSLNGSLWGHVGIVAAVTALGVGLAWVLHRKLDLFALGERSAGHLGVNVEALRIMTMLAVALLVSAAVAFTGVIAFVGLIVPHLMRRLIGPGHCWLLPASALGGALLVACADFAARTLVAYADLPIGMLTSLVGGPFFLWILARERRNVGGWA